MARRAEKFELGDVHEQTEHYGGDDVHLSLQTNVGRGYGGEGIRIGLVRWLILGSQYHCPHQGSQLR